MPVKIDITLKKIDLKFICEELFKIKERELNKPVPILIADSKDLNNFKDDALISNYELTANGFSVKDSVSEEVLVDFKCDWSRIIENHLDILHIFWVHGDTIPDKDVNKNVLVSFNQKKPMFFDS